MHARTLALLILAAGSFALWADEPPAKTEHAAALEALQKFNDTIGGWRGVAMPQRGSAKGAWKEDADWAWSFDKKQPALVINVEESKLLTSARITFDEESKQYRMAGNYADKTVRNFTGELKENKLILISEPDADEIRHRVTITKLNPKRLLVLIERSTIPNEFARIVEVGYTREGTRLAVEGVAGPECVVTGGLGTSTVSFMGKTYYVCCTGCRQAFDDDPAGVIAAFQAKKAAQKK